jgi:hypothetical protein
MFLRELCYTRQKLIESLTTLRIIPVERATKIEGKCIAKLEILGDVNLLLLIRMT